MVTSYSFVIRLIWYAMFAARTALLTVIYLLPVRMLAHMYRAARYMVVLGLYHGLLVLPVMLSLVQPASIAGIIASPKHGPKSARVSALELDAPKP